MPLHIFRCSNGHVSEHLVPMEHDKWQQCPHCDMKARQIPSAPNMYLRWKPAPYDVKDPFEGIDALRGKAGPNELYYKSDKIFVDQGAHKGDT